MMNTENEDLATQVAKKKAEIEHYKGVLSRYWDSHSSDRWYDQGRRKLEGLEAELVQLETQPQPET